MRKTSQHFSQSPVLCKVALVAIMLAFQALLGIGAGVLNAQTVKGSVISGSDNEPLIGASVIPGLYHPKGEGHRFCNQRNLE